MYSNFSQMLSIVQKHHIDCLISFMLKHIFSTWKMTFDYWTARSQAVRCPWWCQVIWSNTQRLSSSQTFVITIELHLSDCTNGIRPAKFITKTIPQGIYCPRSIIKGSFTPAFISFWMKHFATFPVSFPILSSAYSCIVCLHQAAPQKPSLTLWGLVFGLIYRHQSLFVWMSYGLTLLVCSFCGDYKDLYSDWEASSTLSQSLLCSKQTLKRWFFTQQAPPSPNNPAYPPQL